MAELSSAYKYIADNSPFTSVGGVLIFSGNTLIDGIMNRWLFHMGQADTKSERHICVNVQMKIDQMDITKIIGNLLDNAIEASKHIPENERLITVRNEEAKGRLLIIVTNIYEKSTLLLVDNKLKITKSLVNGRGSGLRNADRCVKKYPGLIQI